MNTQPEYALLTASQQKQIFDMAKRTHDAIKRIDALVKAGRTHEKTAHKSKQQAWERFADFLKEL